MQHDPHDLSRFVAAQARNYADAAAELAAGRKATHWMWYVFPQLRGLGVSAMAQRYGIEGPAEARAYLAHPVLGPRLLTCTALVAGANGTARQVMGKPDDRKLQSCMTLFAAVSEDPGPFETVLNRFYDGARCARTLAMLDG